MMEKFLIEHCSPTLASLKTASLFVMETGSEDELRQQLIHWNRELRGKGVSLLALRYRNRKALIYVCRRSRLETDLQKPGVAAFLSDYGYESVEVRYALKHLMERLQANDDFPHEIGIFLGYPLGDVIGFIENAGQNSKCSGCWKVYCNECEAVRIFAQYRKCRSVYMKLWNQGASVLQLCVADRGCRKSAGMAV